MLRRTPCSALCSRCGLQGSGTYPLTRRQLPIFGPLHLTRMRSSLMNKGDGLQSKGKLKILHVNVLELQPPYMYWSPSQAMHESQRERWTVAYMRRALPAFPTAVDALRLAAAVDAAAKLLPVGSLVPVLMARRVAARCAELLQQAEAGINTRVLQQPAGMEPAPGDAAHGGAGMDTSAALQLAQLLAHLLLVVDFHVLPDVTEAAEAAALAAAQAPLRREVHSCLDSSRCRPAQWRSSVTQVHSSIRDNLLTRPTQVCGVMYDVLAGNDDYTRKLQLMRWHQRLQHQLLQPQHGSCREYDNAVL